MNIVQYTPKLQSVLTAFYNRQIVNVPHCYPVKEEEFALAMRGINGKADIQEGGLDIEDPYQGQGIGRYLLQYLLQEMHKVGYRHATISTDWENYRAFLFYSNCGYRVVDWTYELEKHFD